MKAKVLKAFSDSKMKVIHKEGEIIEITQKRFDEINKINDNLLEEQKESDKED